jgi:hypothetical protein
MSSGINAHTRRSVGGREAGARGAGPRGGAPDSSDHSIYVSRKFTLITPAVSNLAFSERTPEIYMKEPGRWRTRCETSSAVVDQLPAQTQAQTQVQTPPRSLSSSQFSPGTAYL